MYIEGRVGVSMVVFILVSEFPMLIKVMNDLSPGKIDGSNYDKQSSKIIRQHNKQYSHSSCISKFT